MKIDPIEKRLEESIKCVDLLFDEKYYEVNSNNIDFSTDISSSNFSLFFYLILLLFFSSFVDYLFISPILSSID